MKRLTSLFLLMTFLAFTMSACGPSPSSPATPVAPKLTPAAPTATPVPPTPTLAPPTPTPVPPTPTPVPQGETIIVTSTADSGPGTLRQALLDAQGGDTITFDLTVFPTTDPATLYVTSELPPVSQGNLTIDASNVGVILDGRNLPENTWIAGLEINSNGNTIQGLQVLNFSPGAGISLSGGAQYNTVGGDRNIGAGPVGQGNLVGNGDIGIRICDDGTSFNRITGNLIGTDATGQESWGNAIGINVEYGPRDNTIGPDNIIAHNKEFGVAILGSNSLGNAILQSSIHGNEVEGIRLEEGGNTEQSAPLIIDFDLAAGTVAGSTCPNCTVEIFSDSEDQGESYEGKATADSAGAFAFNKGAPFSGPHLTATATDLDGNTSPFSTPTSGTSRYVALQEGNALPRTQFQPKRSKELEDNRLGQMFRIDVHTEQEAYGLVEQNSDLGLKWARLSIEGFDWTDVEDTGVYSEYHIDPAQDKVIEGLVENGIEIMYTLVFWDEAIQAGEGYSRFKIEEEILRYLDYAAFIVRHFKGQIQYYELLNEPNIREDTQQYVKVDEYINLVRRAVPVIRQEDPQAKIVAGALTSWGEPGARDYFLRILRSDVMPLVDAFSWHCHNRESPEYAPEFYYNYPSLVQDLMGEASAHGFEGEFIAEELHFRTPINPHPHEPSIYSETVSAKYHARGIVKHLGMDLTTGLALEELEQLPLIVRVVRNLSTVMAGAESIRLPIEIQGEATNIASYTFALSNGDHLVALWTDGVAVDDDPGVKATLTVPGFSAQKVVGIDILNGLKQQMITDVEDGNLVIRDLLVKDYPIILLLTP